MLEINNKEEMEKYYIKEKSTYIFDDDVKFKIDICVNGNIHACNIDAKDINAKDISYYYYCIAYRNLKCKIIEGRRKNSIHTCLDRKIKYIKEE